MTPILSTVIDQIDAEPESHLLEETKSTFFRPTKAFIKWLNAYSKKRLVIDIGCGTGHALREYIKGGVRAAGVEPSFKCGVDDIICGKVEINTAQQSVILHRGDIPKLAILARPCHYGLTRRIAKCILNPKTELLYIGKPDNIAQDITDVGLKAVQIPVPFQIGDDGEEIWQIET